MIMNKRNIEHFCTLFDSNFLPMGMTLHESLMTHSQPFHLWIICMDELVKEQLEMLNLNHVSLIPISNSHFEINRASTRILAWAI